MPLNSSATMTAAQTRGTTRRCTGEMPSTAMASISSRMVREPRSAQIAVPAAPAIMSAVTIGLACWMIARTLAAPGPCLCEIMVDKAQPFAPKLSSRRLDDGTMVTAALEDLAPFLPRDELAENMFIPLLA